MFRFSMNPSLPDIVFLQLSEWLSAAPTSKTTIADSRDTLPAIDQRPWHVAAVYQPIVHTVPD
jgi:hypothetical protein